MRSLFLNIKDKGNPGLRNEIVLGQVTPDKVVRMTKEEMASESVRLLNEKLAEKNLFKAKAVGVTQVSSGACGMACPKCWCAKVSGTITEPLWRLRLIRHHVDSRA